MRFASLVSTSVAVEGLLLFSSAHTASADHSLATASNLSFMDTLEARAARSPSVKVRPRAHLNLLRDPISSSDGVRRRGAAGRPSFTTAPTASLYRKITLRGFYLSPARTPGLREAPAAPCRGRRHLDLRASIGCLEPKRHGIVNPHRRHRVRPLRSCFCRGSAQLTEGVRRCTT